MTGTGPKRKRNARLAGAGISTIRGRLRRLISRAARAGSLFPFLRLHRLVPSGVLVKWSKALLSSGNNFGMDIARIAARSRKGSAIGHLVTLAGKDGDTRTLSHTKTLFDRLPDQEKARYARHGARLAEALGNSNLASRYIFEARRYLIDEIKSPFTSKRQRFLSLQALVRQRSLAAAEILAAELELKASQREKILKEVETIKSRMGRWYPLVETANKNAAETTVWCMKGGEILNLNEVQAAPVVEFLVPTYFADIISGSDPKAHATICAFLRRMLDEFSGRGFAIVPKHQYWLNIGKPSGSWPAVSYHTTGRADGWLHLKDAAVPGFFRFDVQGYAGFSSLSDLICLPPEVKESDPAELEATWTHLQETIVEAKVSKYAQDTEQIDLPEAPFVFFPLQLLSDTVSSLAWIPMLDALMIVAGECEKSGKRMVVKRHPMCKRADVGSALGSLSRSHAVHITSASIHDILPSASLVVTVNSGVGFEALLYGRRVITVGAAEYGVVAERCGTIAQLTAALSTERSVNLLEIKQFMQLYLANSVPHDEPSKIVDWVASHQAARPNTL